MGNQKDTSVAGAGVDAQWGKNKSCMQLTFSDIPADDSAAKHVFRPAIYPAMLKTAQWRLRRVVTTEKSPR